MKLFNDIKKIWNDKGFEITLGIVLSVVIIIAIYRKLNGQKTPNKRDYFSQVQNSYFAPSSSSTPSSKQKRRPPQNSKGEIECRRVLEHLFQKPFPNARPDFLRNPVSGGNFNLELDCYCEELGLAVEYSGKQHFEYIPYFHRNKDAFTNQKYRDNMKERLCRDNGVNLIIVPYTIQESDIASFIGRELRRIGYKI